MMRGKTSILAGILLLLSSQMRAQGADRTSIQIDSLKKLISTGKQDTANVFLLCMLSDKEANSKPRDAMEHATAALRIAKAIKHANSEARALYHMAKIYGLLSDAPRQLEALQKALAIVEKTGDIHIKANVLNKLGDFYSSSMVPGKALGFLTRSLELAGKLKDTTIIAKIFNSTGGVYYNIHEYAKALFYWKLIPPLARRKKDNLTLGTSYNNIASTYNVMGDNKTAFIYFDSSLQVAKEYGDKNLESLVYANIGNVHLDMGEYKEAIRYVNLSLPIAKEIHALPWQRNGYRILSDAYEKLKEPALALSNYKKFIEVRDSIAVKKQAEEVARMEMQYGFAGKEAAMRFEQEKKDLKARAQLLRERRERNFFIMGFGAILLLSIFIFRQYRQKEAANGQLGRALEELKHSQQQLVMAEKMASLGQLTAGVAHEINNPINFISGSLKPLRRDIEDVLSVMKKYESSIAEEKRPAVEAFRNEMEMEYAVKEIQALLESIEMGALRTSEIVNGLRHFSHLDQSEAKQADLHESLESVLLLLNSRIEGKIEVIKNYGSIPQVDCYPAEMNQVFMNILNNAVQAIEGQGEGDGGQSDDRSRTTGYGSGTLTIKTWQEGNEVKVSIRDTGSGMNQEVQQRIFEPFFTTKDVGKGAGLGLSTSYGIIQRHKGRIDVWSREGEGTEFVISLPV